MFESWGTLFSAKIHDFQNRWGTLFTPKNLGGVRYLHEIQKYHFFSACGGSPLQNRYCEVQNRQNFPPAAGFSLVKLIFEVRNCQIWDFCGVRYLLQILGIFRIGGVRYLLHKI